MENGKANITRSDPVPAAGFAQLTFERDDLTLEEAIEATRTGWTKVRGRSPRAMLLQLAEVLAHLRAMTQVAQPCTEGPDYPPHIWRDEPTKHHPACDRTYPTLCPACEEATPKREAP